ncbi:MAG: winged helix-turn-helix transcriptional regulator [Solirubrobacterales bacterium]
MTGTTLNLDTAKSPAAESEFTEVCPHFHAAIELIGKRWSGAIIWALSERPMRFAELKRAIPGLSDRLLSQRLRELESAGLMDRTVEEGQPVKVTYELTGKGLDLRPAIQALRQWACHYQENLP